MATRATSNRFGRQPAMKVAKAVVAALGIVALSYVTVTSIEHSLGSRAASAAFVGAATPGAGVTDRQATGEMTGATGPCATLPDLTCAPSRYPSTAAQPEELPPTF